MDINKINGGSNAWSMPQFQSSVEAPKQSVEELSPKTTAEFNKQNEEEMKQKLRETVDTLNSQMEILGTDLKFGYNDKINSMFVNVLEKSSGKLIRKFPTEEAMRLAEHMKEFVGMLFDKKG